MAFLPAARRSACALAQSPSNPVTSPCCGKYKRQILKRVSVFYVVEVTGFELVVAYFIKVHIMSKIHILCDVLASMKT